MTALAIVGLAPDAATITGRIRLDGADLVGRDDRAYAALRGERVAMVFQDPRTALNPVMRVGRQISEPVRLHRGAGRREAARLAVELCARVGLPDPERIVRAYPHQLSGGQRQRVGIAMALACRPALLIADEPTTALDVTVQAEVMALLRQLVAEDGTALLFISHDIALVSGVVDDVLVMRDGRIVERGPVAAVTGAPRARLHPPAARRRPADVVRAARRAVTRRRCSTGDGDPARVPAAAHVAVRRAGRAGRPRRRRRGDPRGRQPRHRRRVGLGQVDARAHPARPRPGDVGHGHATAASRSRRAGRGRCAGSGARRRSSCRTRSARSTRG